MWPIRAFLLQTNEEPKQQRARETRDRKLLAPVVNSHRANRSWEIGEDLADLFARQLCALDAGFQDRQASDGILNDLGDAPARPLRRKDDLLAIQIGIKR